MAEEIQPTPEVMDLTLICQSFPRLPKPLIPRDNLLNTIEFMFAGEIDLVMIEGARAWGKLRSLPSLRGGTPITHSRYLSKLRVGSVTILQRYAMTFAVNCYGRYVRMNRVNQRKSTMDT